MGFWQFLDALISHPPLWIIAIVAFLLASAALRKIAEITGMFSTDRVIELLELVLTLGLLYLVIKAQVSEGLAMLPHADAWQNQPIAIVILFVVATLLSMVIIYCYKKL